MPSDRNASNPSHVPSGFFALPATTDGQRNLYGQPYPIHASSVPFASMHAAPPGGVAGQYQGVMAYTQSVSHYGYAAHPSSQQSYQTTPPHAALYPVGYAGNAFLHGHSENHSYSTQMPLQSSSETKEKKFRCEPCNLELDSAQALQTHQSTHIKCERCSFAAAPKVVKGHFAGVHGQYSGSGFKSVTIAIPGVRKVQRFSICVGNHPDDIQRWIAERRRRFPRQSQKNVAAASENSNAFKEVSHKSIDSNRESEGLSSLLEGYGSSSSDEEETTSSQIETEKVALCADIFNAVPGVSASNTGSENVVHQENYRTRPCRYFMRNGKCRNGDHCNFSHDQSSRDSERKVPHPDGHTPKKPKIARDQPSKRNEPSSLLHKLLANDIQREAALTLQLLEFIVMSNFLQDSSAETTCSPVSSDIVRGDR